MRILIVTIITFIYSIFRVQCQQHDYDILTHWVAGERVAIESVEAYGVDSCFRAMEISDDIFARINGISYKSGTPVDRRDLRYLKLLHTNADMNICLGEMICHKSISRDVIAIFRALFEFGYPIERMVLIDEYNASDVLAMAANNSSSFNFRAATGSQKLSKHSYGLAIDINPLQNPYVKRLTNGTTKIEPIEGSNYIDRTQTNPYMIKKGDACYREFIKHGFRWGGDWHSVKDYQHFEKTITNIH